jgi:integrase
MTATLIPLPLPDRCRQTLVERLREVVRPEFQTEVIRVAADDPVFGRGACDVDACRRPAWTRRLCQAHYLRWRRDEQPDHQQFIATTGPIAESVRAASIGTFDLRGLGPQARLEVAYAIQCRQQDRAQRLLGATVRHLVGLLVEANVDSLLDVPVAVWLERIAARGWADPARTIGLVRYTSRRLTDLAEDVDAESEFTRDLWRSEVLGIHTVKGTRQIHFDNVIQPWLRAPIKRYARFRLATGKAFASVEIDVRSVRWLSRFIAEEHPEIRGAGQLSRPVVEHYLSWLIALGMAENTTNTLLVCLRGFLETCRRHGWMSGLSTTAAIYLDELPRRAQPLPRFVPEFVMSQIEDDDNLARLPDETTQHLLVLLIETGLRANDACTLPFNPIIDDSVGWPCLKFFNHKMKAEQLVPLSARAADAIRGQQAHLRTRWPACPPAQLFPSPHCNPDGLRPFSYATFRQRLTRWEAAIDLHDEAGQRVSVTAHQFRHTLGTRMINQGVPQHIVQKMLGHASPQMTARYATIHDTTVRAAFDDYQRRRVDIRGERLDFDPAAPAADAEWVKHNLARVASSLPNGYCGRPPQQDCPHPNACLTCPDFQTTPQFLPLHRRQRDDTLVLLTAAEQAGNTRLAANHRQVADNLVQVIDALEHIDQENLDAS